MLRRLAGETAETAALPVHKTKAEMWRRLNRLEPVRPMVWINEVCWEQMGPDVVGICSDRFLRGVEGHLRRTLFQWRHFPADMIVDGWLACPMAIRDSGFGIEGKANRTVHDMAKGAVDYVPVITSLADVEKIRIPEVTHDEQETERRFALMREVFGDIIEVRKVGVSDTWFAPWDRLIQWYGVTELFTDMCDRPELVNAAIDRMVTAQLGQYEQYEAMGLLSLNNRNCRVGSGGLGITDELPAADFDGRVRMIDMWGNSAPQIFAGVGPDMHWQFALRHEMRILERFGLNCYGCCEPYHRKIDLLRRIPRLRRISMSPFVDVGEGAAAIGTDYIYSAKPNPAVLAAEEWAPQPARDNLREILDATSGLHVEIILKDIHTVRDEPRRLCEWERLAMRMVEET